MYGIFIWFLIGWPYIFWKKFAVVELEDAGKVIRYKRSKRIWRLVSLFIFFVMLIFLCGPPRETVQHFQGFLKSVMDAFKR